MKKNVLALSIAAMIGGMGFAGSAAAQFAVNDSGTGHMLLVPYYTAQNDNMSVFHVVNTDTVNGKAVKVRFRGAANSDDVLDFQLFLSPGDVWAAAVTKGADGVAQLTTTDNSCTLPTVKGAAVPFVTARLPATDTANHTREGYVEILNMADIDGSMTYTVGGLSNQHSALYTATKHVNGTAPCTDSVLQGTLAWTHQTASTTTGLVRPTDGLTGSWYIINVPQTTVYSGATTAIVATGTTNNVFSPQANASTGTLLGTADPLFRAALLTQQAYDVPDLSTPYVGGVLTPEAQAGALATLLQRTSVLNQYATDAAVSMKTDWLFSMPTRRYNVAANYAATATTGSGTTTSAGGLALTSGSTAANAYRIVNTEVGNHFTVTNTSVSNGLICLKSIGQKFYDREETSKTAGAVFSPGNVSLLPLCGEVNVLSFASGSVLGASVAASSVNSAAAYTNGWGKIDFASPGVPMLGSAFLKATNPAVSAGVSGTYGVTWPHAYNK